MPGKHSDKTKLLGFYAAKELVQYMDEAREGVSRSLFLREAAVDYMEKRGVKVPPHLKYAPDRAGKGGPVKYPRKSNSRTPKSAIEAAQAAARQSKTSS